MSVRGYEIKCSPWTAEALGAWFTDLYRGRGILHYWNGYLWWIQESYEPTKQAHDYPQA